MQASYMLEEMMKSARAPVSWRHVKSDCLRVLLCTLFTYAGTVYATLAGASLEAGIACSVVLGAMVKPPFYRLRGYWFDRCPGRTNQLKCISKSLIIPLWSGHLGVHAPAP